MDITKLLPGDLIELLVDANAVPAGCYRFHQIQGEMSLFTAGNGVIVGLATDFWSAFMRPTSKARAKPLVESEFARRHGLLLADLQTREVLNDPLRMSFCILTPRVLQKSSSWLKHQVRPIYASELAH
jgi:hypothetical protein